MDITSTTFGRVPAARRGGPLARRKPVFAVSRTRPASGVVVLAVQGELDLLTLPLLDEQLIEIVADDTCRRLVVDLTRLTFCSAAGLGCLVRAREACAVTGTTLRLAIADATVLLPFTATGLDATFTIVASRDRALTC